MQFIFVDIKYIIIKISNNCNCLYPIILYYTFVRGYHRRKLGKGHMTSTCVWGIYNYFKTKRLIIVKKCKEEKEGGSEEGGKTAACSSS